MSRVEASHGDLEELDARELGETSEAVDGSSSVTVDLTQEPEDMLSVVATGRRSVPFVDLAGSYDLISVEIDDAMQRVIKSSDYVLGEAVGEFEKAFASYCGVDHAIGLDSGFSALELILRAHEIGPGDEVITASNTFVATVAAIEACGATPVLVDIDPDTYNIDPRLIEGAITGQTRAILPVHIYGQPARMDVINDVAERYGLWVFEDACQAHGAIYRGRRSGSLGHAAAFSFYPSKNLGAFGDGGMVVTNNEDVAERLRLLRNLGSATKYRHEIKGFNRRLDTMHAAVLGVKLEHLDEGNASRRQSALLYQELLSELPLSIPRTSGDAQHVYHLFVIQVSDRAKMQRHLDMAGVATGIHYPIPIHLQPAYKDLGSGLGSFPCTEAAADRILSLPMYAHMSFEDTAYVAHAVRDFFSG